MIALQATVNDPTQLNWMADEEEEEDIVLRRGGASDDPDFTLQRRAGALPLLLSLSDEVTLF